MNNFYINQECYYLNNNQQFKCIIKNIYQKFGPSIINDKLSTMDYSFNTYYDIQLENGRIITISQNFLKQKTDV